MIVFYNERAMIKFYSNNNNAITQCIEGLLIHHCAGYRVHDLLDGTMDDTLIYVGEPLLASEVLQLEKQWGEILQYSSEEYQKSHKIGKDIYFGNILTRICNHFDWEISPFVEYCEQLTRKDYLSMWLSKYSHQPSFYAKIHEETLKDGSILLQYKKEARHVMNFIQERIDEVLSNAQPHYQSGYFGYIIQLFDYEVPALYGIETDAQYILGFNIHNREVDMTFVILNNNITLSDFIEEDYLPHFKVVHESGVTLFKGTMNINHFYALIYL